MKITRVEPILVALPYEHGGPKPVQAGRAWATMDTLFIRVETDEGVVGWGEGFGFAVSPVTANALVRLVAPLCIGRDPRQRDALVDELRRRLQNMGLNGPVSFALSGVEIALWDITGKVEGRPLHVLLGGGAVERVPVYASLLRYGDPALVARNVETALARGYRRIKLHEVTEEAVAAARHAGGPDVPLMVDVNCAWNFSDAREMVHRLARHGLFWLEEPISPANDFAALARLRQETRATIAAGENLGSLGEVQCLVERGAVDVLQPSVTKIGGVSETMQAAALARAGGVAVAPHSPYFGPGLIATLHIIAAIGGDVFCERFFCDIDGHPLGDAIAPRDGWFAVPQGPGLGITVDESALERFRVT